MKGAGDEGSWGSHVERMIFQDPRVESYYAEIKPYRECTVSKGQVFGQASRIYATGHRVYI